MSTLQQIYDELHAKRGTVLTHAESSRVYSQLLDCIEALEKEYGPNPVSHNLVHVQHVTHSGVADAIRYALIEVLGKFGLVVRAPA